MKSFKFNWRAFAIGFVVMQCLILSGLMAFSAEDSGPPAVKGSYRSKVHRASVVQQPAAVKATAKVAAKVAAPAPAGPGLEAAIDAKAASQLANAVSQQVLVSLRTEQVRLTDQHKADLQAHLDRLKAQAKADLDQHVANAKAAFQAIPPAVAAAPPPRPASQPVAAAPVPRASPYAATTAPPRYYQTVQPYAAPQSFTYSLPGCSGGNCPTGVRRFLR
jgi:hypothetical protein